MGSWRVYLYDCPTHGRVNAEDACIIWTSYICTFYQRKHFREAPLWRIYYGSTIIDSVEGRRIIENEQTEQSPVIWLGIYYGHTVSKWAIGRTSLREEEHWTIWWPLRAGFSNFFMFFPLTAKNLRTLIPFVKHVVLWGPYTLMTGFLEQIDYCSGLLNGAPLEDRLMRCWIQVFPAHNLHDLWAVSP